MTEIKIERYKDVLTLGDKLKRLLWNITYVFFFRPFSLPIFKYWRNLLLKIFGAQIGKGSVVRASAKIWNPQNLIIGKFTCIGPEAIIYNPAPIILGDKVTISQYAYLCAASHDITDSNHRLVTDVIKVDSFAWVAADAFVGMGVTIGEGAVVGARACVFKDVAPWTVVGGNPAKYIKDRKINGER